MKKHLFRVLWALFLLAAFCPPANANPSKKFIFLLRFFDMNEAAYAYHRHCISTTAGPNEVFLRTLEFVADALFDETVKDDPKSNPESIKTGIMERREKLQYKLDLANIKDGCTSPGSAIAKKHYEEFSLYQTAEVSKFIDERTNK